MMNLPIIFVASSLLNSPAIQTESAELRKAVEGAYAKWNSYTLKRDLKGMASMLSSDFVQVHEDGRRENKAAIMKQMKTMMPLFRNGTSKYTIKHVQGNDNEAFAWVVLDVKLEMKMGKEWKPQRWTMKFVETLKNTPSGWVFTMSQPWLE